MMRTKRTDYRDVNRRAMAARNPGDLKFVFERCPTSETDPHITTATFKGD
jgi:hypothetical protein